MKMEERITVKVRRFTSSTDEKAEYQVYDVPVVPGSSVMDVLDYIHDCLDGTLAYRRHAACRRGVCGKCMILINGKPGLVCQTVVTGDLSLEPPPKTLVIKDLVWTKRKKT